MTKNLKLQIMKVAFIIWSLILCVGKCGMVYHTKQLKCTAFFETGVLSLIILFTVERRLSDCQ
jgi:hypothetical protein